MAEAGLVRALLALLGTGEASCRWTFVPAGRCDVLLADAACDAPDQARSERQAQALLLLGKDVSGGADALQRPLRANELEAALRRPGQLLGCAGDAPAAPAPARTAAPAATTRYKLVRWPPAALLRGEPQRIRMATQLSRRFLSATELGQLTNQDPARCLVLLQLLQGFNLLQVEPASVPSPGVSSPRAAAPAVGWALVRSIKRRLGL
ncbi:hypothetical protein HK414_15385 [Ramlibacter terrae]|uniref:DprA winged helix domain-containing protein n=1 Tax=Ramlibacter terrae TaxID=2732511 RepID=A0ABX6P3C6_9BURK|nr:hypothetical protein HK414_15385 [Ramlibacter terrae]